MHDTDEITVCESCLCASCWHGIFFCQDYLHANITRKSVGELRKLNREHPDYWNQEKYPS